MEDLYKTELIKYENITLQKTTYRKPDITLTKFAEDYNLFEDDKEKNGLYLDIACEYTGIHYHSINVVLFENGNEKILSNHSAYGDGTLCYPTYDSFLMSKILELKRLYPQLEIYIHKKILDKEVFYTEDY
jgi:hypothetical protein